MANDSLEGLLAKLENAANGLSGVVRKRMFGCDGLFANGNIFGLVWKEGRIGVRLPNEIAYAEAMKMPGSSPWHAGTMRIAHWVLVPEAMHDDTPRLVAWVRRAHALALNAPKGKVAASAEPKPAVKKAPAPPPVKATTKPVKTTTKSPKQAAAKTVKAKPVRKAARAAKPVKPVKKAAPKAKSPPRPAKARSRAKPI